MASSNRLFALNNADANGLVTKSASGVTVLVENEAQFYQLGRLEPLTVRRAAPHLHRECQCIHTLVCNDVRSQNHRITADTSTVVSYQSVQSLWGAHIYVRARCPSQ